LIPADPVQLDSNSRSNRGVVSHRRIELFPGMDWVGGWWAHFELFLAAPSFGPFIYLGLSYVEHPPLFIGRNFEDIGMTLG
jgi:hypothetical protein